MANIGSLSFFIVSAAMRPYYKILAILALLGIVSSLFAPLLTTSSAMPFEDIVNTIQGKDASSTSIVNKNSPLRPSSFDLAELYAGHNQKDSNRINLVFVGIRYSGLKTFTKTARDIVGLDTSATGSLLECKDDCRQGWGNGNFLSYQLFALEPFKSHKSAFNIWYYPGVLTTENEPLILSALGDLKNTFIVRLYNKELTKKSPLLPLGLPDTFSGAVNTSSLYFDSTNMLLPEKGEQEDARMYNTNYQYHNKGILLAKDLGRGLFGILDETANEAKPIIPATIETVNPLMIDEDEEDMLVATGASSTGTTLSGATASGFLYPKALSLTGNLQPIPVLGTPNCLAAASFSGTNAFTSFSGGLDPFYDTWKKDFVATYGIKIPVSKAQITIKASGVLGGCLSNKYNDTRVLRPSEKSLFSGEQITGTGSNTLRFYIPVYGSLNRTWAEKILSSFEGNVASTNSTTSTTNTASTTTKPKTEGVVSAAVAAQNKAILDKLPTLTQRNMDNFSAANVSLVIQKLPVVIRKDFATNTLKSTTSLLKNDETLSKKSRISLLKLKKFLERYIQTNG